MNGKILLISLWTPIIIPTTVQLIKCVVLGVILLHRMEVLPIWWANRLIKKGNTVKVREFNTEACEQLNAWLGGYESILKCMMVDNFNWFLHVMLFYHIEHVVAKMKKPLAHLIKNQQLIKILLQFMKSPQLMKKLQLVKGLVKKVLIVMIAVTLMCYKFCQVMKVRVVVMMMMRRRIVDILGLVPMKVRRIAVVKVEVVKIRVLKVIKRRVVEAVTVICICMCLTKIELYFECVIVCIVCLK